MNRQQWKAQQYGSHVNDWWLTWSADDRIRRKLERRQFVKDCILTGLILAATAVIYWGIQ